MVVFWKEDSGRQPQLITPENEGGDETNYPFPPNDDPEVPSGPCGPPAPREPPGPPGPPGAKMITDVKRKLIPKPFLLVKTITEIFYRAC